MRRMVETWIIYGLVAALFWGSYAVVSKMVTGTNYYNFTTNNATLLMLIGIGIVFVGYFLTAKPSLPTNTNGILLGILAGGLWAGGMIFSFLALRGGADVSKLTPIYNTNTLIAVILGILILHELPQQAQIVKVLLGAFLITIGAVLVSS